MCSLDLFVNDNYQKIAVGDGQSEGERVQISDFDIFVRDVVADIFETKKAFPADIPIFILGISMGGAIAVQVELTLHHDMIILD